MQPGATMVGFLDKYGEKLLLLALCGMFFMLPLNRGIYLALYLLSGVGAIELLVFRKAGRLPSFPPVLYLPLLFCLYVAVTPGNFFKDLHLAEIMFLSYVSGVSVAVFLPDKIQYAAGCSLVSLGFSLTYFFVRGLPEVMLWNGRLRLFFDHPAVLSFISGMVLIVLLGALHSCRRPGRRLFMGAACLVIFGIIVSCGARGTFLALAVSSLFLAFTIYRRYWLRFLIVAGVGLVILLAGLSEQSRGRLLSAVQHPTHDATFVSRQPIWDAAVAGIEASPLLGSGVRSFQKFHDQYVAEHSRELSTKYPVIESGIASPHNMYLGFVYGYGAIGVVLFIVAVFPALTKSFSSRQYLFPAILLFYAVYGLFDYPLHRKDGIFLLFFPLGLMYGRQLAGWLQRQSPAQDKQGKGSEPQQGVGAA